MKTAGMSDDEINLRHAEKMAKKKAARDRMLSGKTKERGLLMVHTGKGKGKSTAGMGLAIRSMGNGMRVCIVQFVKGVWQTGEREILSHFPDLCTIRAMGDGFTWDTQDRERDILAARSAWDFVCDVMGDSSYDLIILDELNIVLRYDYLPVSDVVSVLVGRRSGLHVLVTGRNAKEELLEVADLVTDMVQVRHHFRDGVKAQVGIEF